MMMKAVLFDQFGAADQLYIGDTKTPEMGAAEVLVKVKATALNRADILQRKGFYPPPPGASTILGLEMCGEIVALGDQVSGWKIGDRVMALLPGGGYAAYVNVPHQLLLPLADSMTFEEGAAIAEAFLTSWQAVVWLANLQAGEKILIHAGASGVGTAAIQIARQLGAEVVVTASAGKHDYCRDLGASLCIDYATQDFAAILNQTPGNGVDVILDFIGGPYWHQNIQCLRTDGRLVLLGFMGGMKVEQCDLAPILRKRLKVIGTTLRARSLDYKIQLSQDFKKQALPWLDSGKIKPVIDSLFDWTAVKEAHLYMEGNKNKGKVVLKVNDFDLDFNSLPL